MIALSAVTGGHLGCFRDRRYYHRRNSFTQQLYHYCRTTSVWQHEEQPAAAKMAEQLSPACSSMAALGKGWEACRTTKGQSQKALAGIAAGLWELQLSNNPVPVLPRTRGVTAHSTHAPFSLFKPTENFVRAPICSSKQLQGHFIY